MGTTANYYIFYENTDLLYIGTVFNDGYPENYPELLEITELDRFKSIVNSITNSNERLFNNSPNYAYIFVEKTKQVYIVDIYVKSTRFYISKSRKHSELNEEDLPFPFPLPFITNGKRNIFIKFCPKCNTWISPICNC